MIDRQPPNDLNAEVLLLGAMLASPEAVADLHGAVMPEDFYRPAHALICHAISDLHTGSEPITVTTVADKLASQDHLDRIGGTDYLQFLAEMAEYASHPLRYARVVHVLGVRRHVIQFAASAMRRAYDLTESIPGLLEQTAAEMPTISAATHPRRCSCRARREPS